MRYFSLIIAFLFLLSSGALHAAERGDEISGRVVSVSDGDTLKILTVDKREVRIRLSEIDAPEKDQPYGNNAKQAMSKLVFGKVVTAKVVDTDRYGRIVAWVYLGDLNINKEMIRQGMAWAYRQYLSDKSLLSLEEAAQNQKVGLWSLQEDQRMAPWEWRHDKKTSATSSTVPAATSKAGSSFACGLKTYCRQMSNCAEAFFYLRQCGISRLDGDRDGVPCESICR